MPFGGLTLQVQCGAGSQLGHLVGAEEQPYLRLPVNAPPLASPIALAPQLEIASFGFHCAGNGAEYTRKSCGFFCELLWKSC